jgi:hypothetical protein
MWIPVVFYEKKRRRRVMLGVEETGGFSNDEMYTSFATISLMGTPNRAGPLQYSSLEKDQSN